MMNSIMYQTIRPLKYFEVSALKRTCARKRAIVLTYDDGPCPRMTPSVLDILKASNAKATFFVVGHRVDESPDLPQRLLAGGHEIGSHSMNHLHALKVGSSLATQDFVEGMSCFISHGISPVLHRPPYGKMLWKTRQACIRAKCTTAWWTVDSGDSLPEVPSCETIIENVKRSDGGVVLMHDLDRRGEHGQGREKHVLQVTDALLRLAAQEDLVIMTMSNLLELSSSPDSTGTLNG